jgi:hypothetical protein
MLLLWLELLAAVAQGTALPRALALELMAVSMAAPMVGPLVALWGAPTEEPLVVLLVVLLEALQEGLPVAPSAVAATPPSYGACCRTQGHSRCYQHQLE